MDWTEAMQRLFVTYLCQFIIGLILFFIFRHFEKQFQRKLLKSWSWSWLAFCLCQLGLMITVSQLSVSPVSFARFFSSLLAQSGCFLQCAFVVVGVIELSAKRFIPAKIKLIVTVFALVLAFLAVLAFSQSMDPSGTTYRYALRYGLRSLSLFVAFLYAGALISTKSKSFRGFGMRLLGFSFLTFSFLHLSYCVVVIFNIVGTVTQIPSFFGLVDLLIISLIALSMVMWLLEDERERLDKVNRELDSFLYTTSHDLRAPLASILGLTHLASREVRDEKSKLYFGMIEGRVQKMDDVIHEILTLTRVIKADVELEQVNFGKLLNEVLTDIKFRPGANKIEIRLRGNQNQTFITDRRQLKVILDNLISNAYKYHIPDQANPYIQVSFETDSEHVNITISDNGEGIPAEFQQKVFNIFFRASNKSEGTGIGLYLVKEAVGKLGGTIDLHSEFGKGSSFVLQFKKQPYIEQ